MQAEQYKHVLKLREDTWFLRLYAWLWMADVHQVDACKLFWATLFAPFWFPLRVTIVPLGRWGASWYDNTSRERMLRALEKPAEPKKPSKPSSEKPSRFLRFVGGVASRIILFMQKLYAGIAQHKRFWTWFGRGLIGLGFVVGIAGIGFIVWWLITHPHFALGLAVAVGCVVAVAALIVILAAVRFFEWAGEQLHKLREPANTTGRGFKAGLGVILVSLHAVKANTCPRVEVLGNDDADRYQRRERTV